MLTRGDLASGRLACLPGSALTCRTAYGLVRPARGPVLPAVEEFAAWLFEQARAFDTDGAATLTP